MLINGENYGGLSVDNTDNPNVSYFYDNVGEQQDLLSALSQDLDIPMLMDQDPFINLLETSLSDDSLPQTFQNWNFDDIIESELNESQNSSIKQEYKHEPNSPPRSTPSPSLSNSSNEINLENLKNESSNNIYNNHLDTPPISPQEGLLRVSPKISFQSESVIGPVVIAQNPVHYIQIPENNVKILTKTCPGVMKRPPIQPKPIAAGITKKRNSVVLSPEQFANLAKSGKLQSNIDDIKQDLAIMKNEVKVNPQNLVKTIKSYESRPGSSLLNIEKDLESRALKKHQRMIKNRESACLSRKKKKEYVISLENKITELTQENALLKEENAHLKARLSAQTVTEDKIHPHHSLINISPNARKNTAFLLAMLVMVSFNIGSFGNIFTKTDVTRLETEASKNIPLGRHLLWVDNQNLDYDSLNSDEGNEIKINMTSAQTNYKDFKPSTEIHPICPMFINVSESLRLESELRKWIGVKQLFTNKSYVSDKQTRDDVSIKLLENDVNDIEKPIKSKVSKRHILKDKTKKKILRRRKIIIDKQPETYNELDVFDPKNYAQDFEFYEAIKRRDDTFYVVSFHLDHLLLPALAHNNTSRPKMSLLMPVLGKNNSFGESVQLMQIDCEVTNTSLIKLEYDQIPRHLRPDNSKFRSNKANDSLNFNERKDKSIYEKNVYKPYFIRGGLLTEKPVDSKRNSTKNFD